MVNFLPTTCYFASCLGGENGKLALWVVLFGVGLCCLAKKSVSGLIVESALSPTRATRLVSVTWHFKLLG